MLRWVNVQFMKQYVKLSSFSTEKTHSVQQTVNSVPKQLSFFPTEAVILELHNTHKNEILYKEGVRFACQPKRFSLWLAIETIFK